MNKNALYERMRVVIAKFPYTYREGITEEIKEIFFRLQAEGKREVKDFMLFFDDETNHYRVVVTLADPTLPTANRVFLSFLRFTAYAGANITTSQQTAQGVQYVLASLDEQGGGFCCEIDFRFEEAGSQEQEQRRAWGVPLRRVNERPFSQGEQPEVRWKYKLDSANALPLLAAQGVIYSAGDEGELYAVDAEQGTLRWQWKAQEQHSKITTLPSVDHGVLSVYTSVRSQLGTYKASLSALDALTGRVLWSSPVPALQSIGGCQMLTAQDSIAYLSGTDRNTLPADPQSLCLALDLQTGTQKWLVDVGRQYGTTTPVVANARVYFVTFEMQQRHLFGGYLHALDVQTGVPIWQHPFETHGVQEIVVDGTDIFVAGTVFEVVDALTGMTRWSLPNVYLLQNSALAVSEELIYISYEGLASESEEREAERPHEILLAGGPAREGEVMAVDRGSKEPRWVRSLTYGRSFPERPSVAGEVLYTTWRHLDVRGDVTHATLFVLDAHTGQERRRFEADDLSAPLGMDGVVFIRGQEDQNQYIYALS